MNSIFRPCLVCCGITATLAACTTDIDAPSLPTPESATIAQGVALAPEQLFGIWEGTTSVGTTNANHFEQSYRVEFQSVDDAEAIFSHWFVDATSTTRDSVCNIEYTYEFDGSTIAMTPKTSAQTAGAVKMVAVHTGNNNMTLYTTQAGRTTTVCTLTRSGDPVPTITAVDRTLPQAGETVTLTGRNLQFVDHLFLPTEEGEQEIADFTATSKQIQFTVPEADIAPGYIRCQATGAHVSTYSPAMFCSNCVFFHNFSTQGTSKPYTGTEFENTINITQGLFDKITAVSSDNLPEGHCLSALNPQPSTLNPQPSTLNPQPSTIVSPDSMLCFFGDTLVVWPVDEGLDPGTGMLRFSFGDRMQYVVDHSDGLVTSKTKCAAAAIEMDIYVYSNGQPEWNTGFMSFRLDKDQGKSLTQSWFAQTAGWQMDAPMSFADGWKTFTIPLSAFKVTESEAYATVGSLMSYLKQNNKQAVIKMINYQLDSAHPAQALSSFQFCIANMRLVPYGIPANSNE